jgi:hypothetical protein
MTGQKTTDQDARNFDENKRYERDTWKAERSKESTTYLANRTTSLTYKINNKGDEFNGHERNWKKASSATETKNGEAADER